MEKVTIPVIGEDWTQGAAMRAIRAAQAGAAAVRVGEDFRILPAAVILQASSDDKLVGALARTSGFEVPQGNFDLSIASISFDPYRVVLPSFDAPAGYLQCQKNENHVYELNYDRPTCWRDGGALLTVYAGA